MHMIFILYVWLCYSNWCCLGARTHFECKSNRHNILTKRRRRRRRLPYISIVIVAPAFCLRFLPNAGPPTTPHAEFGLYGISVCAVVALLRQRTATPPTHTWLYRFSTTQQRRAELGSITSRKTQEKGCIAGDDEARGAEARSVEKYVEVLRGSWILFHIPNWTINLDLFW